MTERLVLTTELRARSLAARSRTLFGGRHEHMADGLLEAGSILRRMRVMRRSIARSSGSRVRWLVVSSSQSRLSEAEPMLWVEPRLPPALRRAASWPAEAVHLGSRAASAPRAGRRP